MARNVLDDFIALADGARAAKALLDRQANLEQTVRETEARLADLRGAAAQADLLAKTTAENASKVEAAAVKRAKDIRDAAQADALRVAQEAAHAADTRVAQLNARITELAAKKNALKADVAALEEKESRLGQKVAALRADLASIRAKLS
jgi:chromosome segregation ATPase